MRMNDHGSGGNLQSVLFVCTGNIFRSVTAEYALKAHLGPDTSHVISSAGIDAKPQSMHAWVQARLREKGADLTTHIPRQLTRELVEGADLVICDTMYSLAETSSTKEDWGHSSNVVAIDLCHQARAKRLALFHHDPFHDDEDIERMHEDSIRYEELTRDGPPLEVLCAYDGLEVPL